MMEMELPLGFGMALAQNEDAMHKFEALPEKEKQAVIEQTKQVRSRDEMRALVDKLVTG